MALLVDRDEDSPSDEQLEAVWAGFRVDNASGIEAVEGQQVRLYKVGGSIDDREEGEEQCGKYCPW